MKILHLCDSINPAGLGGYESYLTTLAAWMKTQGHETIIATQAAKRDAPRIEHFATHVIVRLRGNLLEARKWEFFSLPPEEREEAVGRMFRRNDLESNVSLLVQELGELVRNTSPDVIHAHSTYVVFNRALEQLMQDDQLDVPIVLTVHGLPKSLVLPSGERTTDYAQLSKHCPFVQVYGVSEHVTSELRRHLPSSVKVQTLYLGVDVNTFAPRKTGLKQWDLAFMGRIEVEKGVYLFPEMLQHLVAWKRHLKMVITGEGSYRRQLLRELEEANLGGHVTYLGVVPSETVPHVLNSSRVFLYPSTREPFGLSIVEAMACGLPVISTDAYGPTEIITHEWDGILVKPGDAEELMTAARTLLADEEQRHAIARAARETVLKRFTIDRHARSVCECYEVMIKR